MVTPPKICRSTAGKWWSGSGSSWLWYSAVGETETGTPVESGLVSLPVQSVDGGIEVLEAAQHVVEGAVFHHEHDDVLKLLDSWKLRVRHQF